MRKTWIVCRSKDKSQVWSPCYLNDNHTRIKVMEIKSFEPGKFYKDSLNNEQYLCLFDGIDKTEFVVWNHTEREFMIMSLNSAQSETLDLSTLQGWNF